MASEGVKHTWLHDVRILGSHIVATVTIVAASVLFMSEMRKDLEVVRQMALVVQPQVDNSQDKYLNLAKIALDERLERMENKLDRLIERK
jgi:hypothetical protein